MPLGYDEKCPECGSKNVFKTNMFLLGIKKEIACRDCGGWFIVSLTDAYKVIELDVKKED